MNKLPPNARSLDSLGIKPTAEMSAWAKQVLLDKSLPNPSVVGPRQFGAWSIYAVVETHTNPTAENPLPHPHRGVGLYLARDETPVPDTDPISTSLAEGVDVSHFQKGADFARIAGAGYAFASIKVSEGMTVTDDAAADHFARAENAGMLTNGYLFFRPATSDPVDQVRRFVDLAGKIGSKWDLPHALDVEWLRQDNPATPIDESLGGLSPQVFGARVVDAIVELAALIKRKPSLYVAPGFWSLLKGHAAAVVPLCDLWLAHYTEGGRLAPTLAPWSRWVFWQYTATARVPGINGNADVDKFCGTRAELEAYAKTGALPAVKSPPAVDLFTVRGVQKALNIIGSSPKLVEDGAMGPKTKASLVFFQTAYGLPATGTVDSRTRTTLESALQSVARS